MTETVDKKYPCKNYGKRREHWDICEDCPDNICEDCSILTLENTLYNTDVGVVILTSKGKVLKLYDRSQ